MPAAEIGRDVTCSTCGVHALDDHRPHPDAVEILGHRGQHGPLGPTENTVEAVSAALDAGADGVEVDVRVTSDGVAVCLHDPDLGRIGGVPLSVAAASYDVLRRVALPGGGTVSRLVDVADAVRRRGRLVVDVKTGAAQTIAALRATRTLTDAVVSSFHLDQLRTVAAEAPHARRALITDRDVPAVVALHRAVREGCLDVHPHVRPMLEDHAVADRAAALGVRIRCWTVDREVDARLLAVAGVAGIITDDIAAVRTATRWAADTPS